MSRLRLGIAAVAIAVLAGEAAFAATTRPADASERFAALLQRLVQVVEPPPGAPARTISCRLVLAETQGLPREFAGRELRLAYQAPDRLRISIDVDGQSYAAGRTGDEIWAHNAGQKFLLRGVKGAPLFRSDPAVVDQTQLPRFSFPFTLTQLTALMFVATPQIEPSQTIDGVECDALRVTSKTISQTGEARIFTRPSDGLPIRIVLSDAAGMRVRLDVKDLTLDEPWPAEKWAASVRDGDKVEAVAVSHLLRFARVAMAQVDNHVPALGPATGTRKLIATEASGRLEMIDGTRVLLLEGTPAEMGRQHGRLLGKQVRDVAERMLYGVGVGTSLPKGEWFFTRIEEAQRRVLPFVPKAVLEEIDAMADAAVMSRTELRLASFFPELFHCSGFAVFGDATVGGRMYHGRILDYLKGVGLEQNAVVIVCRPTGRHAWVNCGYAGFTGSVTAMNEKRIAIGEMGGGGEGKWDGMPMAQLLRKVMEEASTLDEAVGIMKKTPRTCEYYYVISDGNTRRAVGVYATPDKFETVGPGEAHPRLPHPVKDAVLLSAGDRYETLVRRVKQSYGKLDAEAARHLMDRPVAMTSNIHSVLFAPETLDFWVANADSRNVASHTRYTQYNLRKLLDEQPAEK